MATFVAATSATGTTSSVALAAPTGVVAGDYQIAVIGNGTSDATVTTPSGWTLLGAIDNTTQNSGSLYVYASTTVTASQTFTKGGTNTRGHVAHRVAYRNTPGLVASSFSGTPTGGTTQLSSIALPSKTATAVGQTVVGIAFLDGASQGVSGTATPPANWTERTDLFYDGASDKLTLAVLDRTATATGAITGTVTFTNSGSSTVGAALILEAGPPAVRGLFLPF